MRDILTLYSKQIKHFYQKYNGNAYFNVSFGSNAKFLQVTIMWVYAVKQLRGTYILQNKERLSNYLTQVNIYFSGIPIK